MSGISLDEMKDRYHFAVSAVDSHYFQDESCRKVLKEHFKVNGLEGLGLGDYDSGVIAAGAVLQYLYETQKTTMDHLTSIVPYSTGNYMVLDSSTRRNLELLETMREKQKRGSLLWVLDKTRTAMGARLLRTWIEQPLIHKEEILERQKAIEELNMNYISREELREYLNPVYDLERLIGRISYKSANPRVLLAFRNLPQPPDMHINRPYIAGIHSFIAPHIGISSGGFKRSDQPCYCRGTSCNCPGRRNYPGRLS